MTQDKTTKTASGFLQQVIRYAGSQPSQKGPEQYFTGNVRVDPLFPPMEGSRVSAGLVTFEPGARSAWHTHPGQKAWADGYKKRERLMRVKFIAALAALAFAAFTALPSSAQAQAQASDIVVRVADLEIDPTQLEAYTRAVKEEMSESIQVEPGVLAIYAVAEKDNPTKLRFFEIYANDASYRAHIASPHFKKYLTLTQPMITARKLVEMVPVQLSAKPK